MPDVVAREAARIIAFDQDDRVLLLRGHDPALPERSWWFTPGGGLDEGETAPQAAVRELCEESGLVISEDVLVGPVWERTALFDFRETPYSQHEVFYVVRVDADTPRVAEAWTDDESAHLDDVQWWSIAEVQQMQIEVFPINLGELLPGALAWDGSLRHLGEERA